MAKVVGEGRFFSPGKFIVSRGDKELLNVETTPLRSFKGDFNVSGKVVWAQPADGSTGLKNGNQLKDCIVLMHRRMGHHLRRIRDAELHGAVAVIFLNNQLNEAMPLDIGDKTQIPAAQIPYECNLKLRAEDDIEEENNRLAQNITTIAASESKYVGEGAFTTPGLLVVTRGVSEVIRQTCTPFWSKRGDFDIKGPVVWAQPSDGSGAIQNGAEISGSIVLMHRASGNHLPRITEAEKLGAKAVIFINNGRSQKLDIGGKVGIFSAQLPQKCAEKLLPIGREARAAAEAEAAAALAGKDSEGAPAPAPAAAEPEVETPDLLADLDPTPEELEQLPNDTLICTMVGAGKTGALAIFQDGQRVLDTLFTPFVFGLSHFRICRAVAWSVPDNGSGDLQNIEELNGKIALAMRNQQGPSFFKRTCQMQNVGAAGVIFINDHRPLLPKVDAGSQNVNSIVTVPGALIERDFETVLRSFKLNPVPPQKFRSGHKVEALEPSFNKVVIGTIYRVDDGRVTINIDDANAAVECDIYGGDYAPPGTCAIHNIPLAPPTSWSPKKPFTWAAYLSETDSTGVHPASFPPGVLAFSRGVFCHNGGYTLPTAPQTAPGKEEPAMLHSATKTVFTAHVVGSGKNAVVTISRDQEELLQYASVPVLHFGGETKFNLKGPVVWANPCDGSDSLKNAPEELTNAFVLMTRESSDPSSFDADWQRAQELTQYSRAAGVLLINVEGELPSAAEVPKDITDGSRVLPGALLPYEALRFFRPPVEVGQKVEVIDPRPHDIVPAQVVSVEGREVRVRLDGYSEKFDIRADEDSGEFAPIYTAEHNGVSVAKPPGFEGDFEWHSYLKGLHALPVALTSFNKSIPYFSRCAVRPAKNQNYEFPYPKKESLWVKVKTVNRLENREIRGAGVFCLVSVLDSRGNQTETHMTKLAGPSPPFYWNEVFKVKADAWSKIVLTVLEMVDKQTRASNFLGQLVIPLKGTGFRSDGLPEDVMGTYARKLRPMEELPVQCGSSQSKPEVLRKARETNTAGRLHVELSLSEPQFDPHEEDDRPNIVCYYVCH